MSSSWEPAEGPQRVPQAEGSEEVPEKNPYETMEDYWGKTSAGGTWTWSKDLTKARCNLCDKTIDFTNIPEEQHMKFLGDHAGSRSHSEKKKRALEDQENKRLEAMSKDLVQQKVKEIISCCEDHPSYLHEIFIEMGSFLKVFKVDLQGHAGQSSREFLVTAHHDELEIINEIFDWLEDGQ